jgi:DNA-binding GntR family transcriptional regulator
MNADQRTSASYNEFPSLSDIAYERIKEEILKSRLKPGATYKEVLIAQEIGMSKTPVHEALNRLEHRGFIEMLPRRGFRVTDLNIKSVRHLFEFRRPLEHTVVYKVVPPITAEQLAHLDLLIRDLEKSKEALEYQRADRAIHRYLSALTGNQYIIRSLDMIWELCNWVGMRILEADQGLHVYKHHHEVMHKWITQRNPERTWEALVEHLNHTENKFIESFEKEGTPG